MGSNWNDSQDRSCHNARSGSPGKLGIDLIFLFLYAGRHLIKIEKTDGGRDIVLEAQEWGTSRREDPADVPEELRAGAELVGPEPAADQRDKPEPRIEDPRQPQQERGPDPWTQQQHPEGRGFVCGPVFQVHGSAQLLGGKQLDRGSETGKWSWTQEVSAFIEWSSSRTYDRIQVAKKEDSDRCCSGSRSLFAGCLVQETVVGD